LAYSWWRGHEHDFLPFTRPSIDEATIASVAEVLRSGWITSGPKVQAFEAALSDHCVGRPVRAFNSGTATLEVALRLAGVGAGDTVITTPLTWVATANVILEVGATPILVDVDPLTRNIDLTALKPPSRRPPRPSSRWISPACRWIATGSTKSPTAAISA
jgi:dTDP-4-amino-4,6-dideoxygalactose transaminase